MDVGISFDFYEDNILKNHVDRLVASYDSKNKIIKYIYEDVENIIEMNEQIIFKRITSDFNFSINISKKNACLELNNITKVDIEVLYVNFKMEPSKILMEYQLESHDEGKIKLIIIPEEALI